MIFRGCQTGNFLLQYPEKGGAGMTYFEYLRKSGDDDAPESYVRYLTKFCGYAEDYAESMAKLEFGSCPKSVTGPEIWSPANMGDAMFIS